MICFAMKHMEEKIQYKSFRSTQMDLLFITKGKISIKIYQVFICINIIFFIKCRKLKSCEIKSIYWFMSTDVVSCEVIACCRKINLRKYLLTIDNQIQSDGHTKGIDDF